MNVIKPLMLLAEFVASPRGLRRIFADGANDPAAESGDEDHRHVYGYELEEPEKNEEMRRKATSWIDRRTRRKPEKKWISDRQN